MREEQKRSTSQLTVAVDYWRHWEFGRLSGLAALCRGRYYISGKGYEEWGTILLANPFFNRLYLNHIGSRRLLGKQCYKAGNGKPGEPHARGKVTKAHFAQNCPARKREYDSHEGWEVATWKGLRIRRKRDTQLKVRAKAEIRAAAASASTAASVHSCRNTGCT